jgi:hypothetical protein
MFCVIYCVQMYAFTEVCEVHCSHVNMVNIFKVIELVDENGNYVNIVYRTYICIALRN